MTEMPVETNCLFENNGDQIMDIKNIRGETLLTIDSDTLEGADLSGADLSGADLSDTNLSDADLSGANLSGANLSGAGLIGADLSDADLSGANLSDADLRRAKLSGADLSGANLSDADLRRAKLSGAGLIGADLSDADLSGAGLSGANLSGANLSGAGLSGADLSGANLSDADLRRAKLPLIISIDNLFSFVDDQIRAGGNLDMGDWHTCETTHCIAGWVTTLAGDAGRVAENLLGTNAAAALIINQSCPYLEGKVPNFYVTNEGGLEFIKNCAEKERQILAQASNP
ncbi:MAG: pentapeptide repeat-containing protein [Nitrosomonas sp.]|nr:pentapeptide repeat-containing protein [Nitrosomonas sp.]